MKYIHLFVGLLFLIPSTSYTLRTKLKEGQYDKIEDPSEFAEVLTKDVQSFNEKWKITSVLWTTNFQDIEKCPFTGPPHLPD